MNKINNTDNEYIHQITNSLVNYLPDISSSLLKLIDYLKRISGEKKDDNNKENNIELIIIELTDIVPNISSMVKEVRSIEKKKIKSSDDELLKLYDESLNNMIIGFKAIIKWIKEEDESEENLNTAVNKIYIAGEQTLKLVNMITR